MELKLELFNGFPGFNSIEARTNHLVTASKTTFSRRSVLQEVKEYSSIEALMAPRVPFESFRSSRKLDLGPLCPIKGMEQRAGNCLTGFRDSIPPKLKRMT
ncbi:hypothetical protein CEXT_294181 [Caerostris extrusa]|uniref:Uncharacterized protein n=1 Tax=Caerostris extrusa TaxID=172846 RepID=A0AAV4S9A1_CAEEX|nr:hypothetical protein CEXT_294181 [Caerostris extrusa]